MKTLSALLAVALLAGCAGLKPQRGGSLKHKSAVGSETELSQPENPKDATTQRSEGTKEERRAYPPGTTIRETETVNKTNVIVREFTVPTNAPAPLVIETKVSDKNQ